MNPAQEIADAVLCRLADLDPADAGRLMLSAVLPVLSDAFRSESFRQLALDLAGKLDGSPIAAALRTWADEVGRELADPTVTPIQTPIADAVRLLMGRGKPADAEKVCRHRLSHHPADADALWLLSATLGAQGKAQEAIDAQKQSLSLRPLASRYACHAIDLNRLDRLDEAVEAMERATSLRPDDMRLCCELAAFYHGAGRPIDTDAAATEALERAAEPLVQAKAYLMCAAAKSDGSAASLDCLRKACDLAPHWRFARLCLGEELIRAGQWEEGWRAYQILEETRDEPILLGMAPPPEPYTPKPLDGPPFWTGEDIAGKTLLIRCWAGLGDMIQFARFVPMLAERGIRVKLQTRPVLADLLRCLPCEVAGETDYDADVQCWPFALPMLLGMTPDTLPNAPYLTVDADKAKAWADRLHGPKSLRVGLCWQGNTRYAGDRERSMPLRQLTPLAEVPNIRLYSLQKGDGAEQVRRAGFPLIDHTHGLHTLADTAALIANLDLVVSVDTAVAHVAGALGKPTMLLLPYQGEWRWGTHPTQTVWYPAHRLWRQAAPGEWGGVVGRLSDCLAGF